MNLNINSQSDISDADLIRRLIFSETMRKGIGQKNKIFEQIRNRQYEYQFINVLEGV